MPQFVITKTTLETLGIEAASLSEAHKAAQSGGGESISINTTINVRPRPAIPEGSYSGPNSTVTNRPTSAGIKQATVEQPKLPSS